MANGMPDGRPEEGATKLAALPRAPAATWSKGASAGRRSATALVAEQLALELGDLETSATPPVPANDDAPAAKPPGQPRKKARRNIGALPKHLPRCEQVLEPDTTACPCCQGRLHKIGEDVNEVLDVIPAILRVLRTIRPKYACRCTDGVVQAKVLSRLIESGMASTALASQVVVSKFAWYLSLYRQVQILAGQGVHLDRATFAGWVKRTAWWLETLYELQLRTIQASPRVFCDETPMPVLDPGRGRTRTCQFWAHAMDDRPWSGPSPPAVAYVFAASRGTDEIAGQLTGSAAFCRWTAMPPTRRVPAAMAARSSWHFAWCMPDAGSSTCTRRRGHRSRRR
jgi:transposase